MSKKSKQIEGQLDFFALLNNNDSESAFSDVAPFIECELCWCKDCKHNENNEGIPRDFGGEEKACPACSFCVENDEPEICEIGSAKNGCRLRASEEGLI